MNFPGVPADQGQGSGQLEADLRVLVQLPAYFCCVLQCCFHISSVKQVFGLLLLICPSMHKHLRTPLRVRRHCENSYFWEAR